MTPDAFALVERPAARLCDGYDLTDRVDSQLANPAAIDVTKHRRADSRANGFMSSFLCEPDDIEVSYLQAGIAYTHFSPALRELRIASIHDPAIIGNANSQIELL